MAVMPLKKAVQASVDEGDKLVLLNLAAVPQVEQGFVLGLNSAKLITDRAEGALVVFGANTNVKPMLEKYGDDLQIADSEDGALALVIPSYATGGDKWAIAVLGAGEFQDKAFEGVHHYRGGGVFYYYTSPEVDLADILARKPRLVFMNARLGAAILRNLRAHIGKINTPDSPVYFVVFGLPNEQNTMRTLVQREGFDDAMMIPFTQEVTLHYLDVKQFRALLTKKIEVMESGFYNDLRERKTKMGNPG